MSKRKFYSGYDIQNENEVLLFLLENKRGLFSPVYPKVKRISRNIVVSPDIDLLVIDGDNMIGYETKFVKVHKGHQGYVYDSIYKGLGQALLYLNFGVDSAYLTLAFENHKEIPIEKRNTLWKKIAEVEQSIYSLGLQKYLGLEIIEIFPKYFSYQSIINPSINIRDGPATDFEKGMDMGMNLVIKPDGHDFLKKSVFEDQFSFDIPLFSKRVEYVEHESRPLYL